MIAAVMVSTSCTATITMSGMRAVSMLPRTVCTLVSDGKMGDATPKPKNTRATLTAVDRSITDNLLHSTMITARLTPLVM